MAHRHRRLFIFALAIGARLLQIVNRNWWIGRVVGRGAVCKFVPSPTKFIEKYENMLQSKGQPSKFRLNKRKGQQQVGCAVACL